MSRQYFLSDNHSHLRVYYNALIQQQHQTYKYIGLFIINLFGEITENLKHLNRSSHVIVDQD